MYNNEIDILAIGLDSTTDVSNNLSYYLYYNDNINCNGNYKLYDLSFSSQYGISELTPGTLTVLYVPEVRFSITNKDIYDASINDLIINEVSQNRLDHYIDTTYLELSANIYTNTNTDISISGYSQVVRIYGKKNRGYPNSTKQFETNFTVIVDLSTTDLCGGEWSVLRQPFKILTMEGVEISPYDQDFCKPLNADGTGVEPNMWWVWEGAPEYQRWFPTAGSTHMKALTQYRYFTSREEDILMCFSGNLIIYNQLVEATIYGGGDNIRSSIPYPLPEKRNMRNLLNEWTTPKNAGGFGVKWQLYDRIEYNNNPRVGITFTPPPLNSYEKDNTWTTISRLDGTLTKKLPDIEVGTFISITRRNILQEDDVKIRFNEITQNSQALTGLNNINLSSNGHNINFMNLPLSSNGEINFAIGDDDSISTSALGPEGMRHQVVEETKAKIQSIYQHIDGSLGLINIEITTLSDQVTNIGISLGAFTSDISRIDSSMIFINTNFVSLQSSHNGLSGTVYSLDTSMAYAYRIINDISNIDISGELLSLNSLVENIGISLGAFTSDISRIDSSMIFINTNFVSLQSSHNGLSGTVYSLDTSMIRAFELMNDISNIDNVFDFYDISRDLISLASLVESADTSINTLEGKTAALETHSSIVDASIIDVYEGITYLESLHGLSLLTTIDISNNLDTLNLRASNTDASMIRAFELMNDISNIDNVFDFYDISRDLISLASLVESADTSINTLEGKTAALETHSSIVDASIIDVYEGITYLESLHGLSLLTTIDISNNLDTLNLRASNTDASMIRAFELMNDISNIDNVFDFYDISRDLISLASLVESADTSINTLEGKTAALETHSSIVDASIIDVYEGITYLESLHGLSLLTTIDISNNLDTLNLRASNTDASMIRAFELMNDISNIDNVFDFYDISRDLISLASLVESADTSINTLEGKTAALETHSSIVDASIIDVYEGITYLESLHGLSLLTTIDISNNLDTLNLRASNTDASMIRAFELMNDISNIDNVFDFYDISRDLISLASLVESADTSINTLEGKTAALETHSSIVDASIIDVYEGITYLESLHGLSLLTTIDISNNLDTLNLRASNTDASMIRAFELMNDISNIDNVFDFYDISRDLISLASLVESADTSINTLEGKTAALETHSSIVDASIIDVYEGITYLESLHGLSLLTTIDISNNLDTLNLRASNTDASMIRAFELI